MKLYTKTGDDGTTSLFNGDRVDKDSPRIEACGAVDELNSVIGLAAVVCRFEELGVILKGVQDTLFELGAQLATPVDGRAVQAEASRVGGQEIGQMEGYIDVLSERMPALRQFILPGGGELAGRLHLARTVCRRAERLCVTLARGRKIPQECVVYLNRLGDLLFAMARRANQLEGVADVVWTKKA